MSKLKPHCAKLSNDTTIFVGNSHLAAINAVKRKGWRFIHSSKVNKAISNGGLLTELIPVTQQPLISLIGGNTHNVIGLLKPKVPFDTVDPDHGDGPADGYELVPFEVICSQIAWRGRRWLATLVGLGNNYDDIVHVDPPPPVSDSDFILDRISSRMDKAGTKNVSVNPASIRLKLWKANNRVFRQYGEPLGVKFVSPPVEAIDDRGFLREKFWEDATHANGHYGDLVVRKLEELGYVAPL